MSRRVREYYAHHPLMVSSPFGGVDSVNHDLLGKVFESLEIRLDGKAVLDVGCGRGFLSETVERAGGRYAGVDFVLSRGGFRLALAEATVLPFPEGCFDAVFCIDAFEHFTDPSATAAEFRRVLRPGGFIFLSAPNYANVAGMVKKICERLGWYNKNCWAPFRNWQPQEHEMPLTGKLIRRVFRRAGFSRFRRIGHPPEVVLGLFPWNDHPGMPEAIRFRLQRLFNRLGPAVVRVWPGASLHGFWKID